jgi:hypothetical protein
MPRLFSKFATNSYPGSGLGLFIYLFLRIYWRHKVKESELGITLLLRGYIRLLIYPVVIRNTKIGNCISYLYPENLRWKGK